MDNSNEKADTFYCPQMDISSAIQKSYKHNARNYNIVISNKNENEKLPSMNPIELKKDIKDKINKKIDKINNLKYTRNGKIIISTDDADCAVEVLKIQKLLNTEVKLNVIWENITSRVLIHNIQTSIKLESLYKELKYSNPDIDVKDLRRFIRPGTNKTDSPVLVTILGLDVPDRIKYWLTSYKTELFIDRPRSCGKCHKFDHTTRFCKETAAYCGRCNELQHGRCFVTEDKCVCHNCLGNHPTNSKTCEFYKQEQKILEFKCLNRLTVTEARRLMKPKEKEYNKVTSTEQDNTQKVNDSAIKRIEELLEKYLKRMIDLLSNQNPRNVRLTQLQASSKEEMIREKPNQNENKNKRQKNESNTVKTNEDSTSKMDFSEYNANEVT